MSASTMSTTWTVELKFEEDQDHTVARASLTTPEGRTLRAEGRSRRNPSDRPKPSIGEETAGARALSDLAHELLDVAAGEIEANVHGDDPRV